jgi:phage terminase small subunit
MTDQGLTNKRLAFVNEYLRDFNATQAAIRAGYSPNTARSQGQRLLTNVDIAAAVKEGIAEKGMGAEEVLLRLAEHARGDMGDFLDIGSMGFVIDLNSAKEKGITHLIKKVKMRTQTSVDKSGIETETHDMEIELYDAQAALVQLGRYHKLFTDKQELTQRTIMVKMGGEEVGDE